MLTFGSLFAGCGGMCLGFQRAGMQCKFQVELNEYCRRILEQRFPFARRWDDVRTFPPSNSQSWNVDVLCGGDPCQANSKAGNSKQQSLGGEFIRVVDALRPRVVVRENPTGTRSDAPWPWWKFRSALESLGYAVLPFRLRACCLGAEHRRDRLFLLAEDAHANGNGLEGRAGQAPEMESVEPARLVETYDWPEIPADPGFDSRAGLTTYVDEVRALGNCVCPQVSEYIGRRIVEAVEKTNAG